MVLLNRTRMHTVQYIYCRCSTAELIMQLSRRKKSNQNSRYTMYATEGVQLQEIETNKCKWSEARIGSIIQVIAQHVTVANRARIFKLLRSPRIDSTDSIPWNQKARVYIWGKNQSCMSFKEPMQESIPSLAGWYDNHI
jgi:hypothetical protein